MTTGAHPSLALCEIEKDFDYRPVLTNVSVQLQPGQVDLLTAKNGSGKTTLLQIMAGLLRPTRGKVLWQGRPLSARGRKQLGVVFQQPMLYNDLTGQENLEFYASLYGLPGGRTTAMTWLARLGLEWAADQRVQEYSKGMRQRLAIARSLLHEPSVLLWDEPFDGLDDEGRQVVERLLAEAADRGCAVFMVTHQLEHRALAHRHFTLQRGRLVDIS